jgi:hypothetical protein
VPLKAGLENWWTNSAATAALEIAILHSRVAILIIFDMLSLLLIFT